MTIKTERLTLRPFEMSGAEDVFEYSQNENVGKTLGGNSTKVCKKLLK